VFTPIHRTSKDVLDTNPHHRWEGVVVGNHRRHQVRPRRPGRRNHHREVAPAVSCRSGHPSTRIPPPRQEPRRCAAHRPPPAQGRCPGARLGSPATEALASPPPAGKMD
jgi:hypothetical protein